MIGLFGRQLAVAFALDTNHSTSLASETLPFGYNPRSKSTASRCGGRTKIRSLWLFLRLQYWRKAVLFAPIWKSQTESQVTD